MSFGGMFGGQGGQSGQGGGLPQMQLAQMALQEKNREAADRWRLAQGINEAMNDSAWLMSHFPNFWGSSYVNPNAGAVESSLGQQNATFQSAIEPIRNREQSEYEMKAKKDYEGWKSQQDLDNFRQMVPEYQKIYGTASQSSSSLTYDDLVNMRNIIGR